MANNMTRYNQPTGFMPLSEAVDRLFRDAFTSPRTFGDVYPTASRFGPSSNLYETHDSYIMQVPLPGVTVDELEITAHENVLTLRGKSEVTVPEGAQSIWVGMGGGEFREEVTLPGDVNADQASAEYRDGILTLTLPKTERAKVRQIKVGGQPQAIEGQKT
ncbi:MAG TPA: Hsp20/alpha crystallin family protein [Chloroflexota bacterium]|nr:Hsp20/alpha crystallin family protein [Chloroflexota bacterium]